VSIAHSMRFTRHAWAMPQIPGFPLGVWSASDDDEGDATGGAITFQHIFRNTSNNLGDTNLYNIEHLFCGVQDATQDACRLTINGMDPGTGQGSTSRPIDRVYTFSLIANDVPDALFIQSTRPRDSTVPIWVGTYDGPDTDLGDMIIALENKDGDRVSVGVYGYYWAPGAVNAPGGIQRPPNGLWRA